MKNLWKYVDNALMYGANKSVHAWNWTTGKTKADLARKLVTIAPALEISGMALNSPYFAIILFAPIVIINSIVSRNIYKKVEEGEVMAQESGVLDLESEYYKHRFASYGEVCLIVAGANASLSPFVENPLGPGILATGLGTRAASCYVIRADYLPPRKNVLSRAKDKLVEIVENYKTKPGLVPVPII